MLKDLIFSDPLSGATILFPIDSTNQIPILEPTIYQSVSDAGKYPLGKKIISKTVDFVTNIETFTRPLTITMTLTGQAIDPAPYYWDTNTDRWTKSGLTIVSKTNNSLAFTTNHLSKFAIFDVTNNLSDIVVYPNPYKKGMSSGIVFDGLSGGETIKIYTITGESVIEQQSEGLQKWIWNTRNSSGEQIASGIYLYLITGKGGQKRIGKIAVIK